MDRREILKCIEDVRVAKRVLCELYPRVGGYDEPKCAGVVLRRFFVRERDLIGFLEIYLQEEDLEETELEPEEVLQELEEVK